MQTFLSRRRARAFVVAVAALTASSLTLGAEAAFAAKKAPKVRSKTQWFADDFTVAPGGKCEIRTRTGWANAAQREATVGTGRTSVHYSAVGSMRANKYYEQGYFGQGVDVALIDSGVAPVAGLTGGNVLPGPDLSFESQAPYADDPADANPDLASKDTFGHGTHLAGIIAGSDAPPIDRGALEAGKPESYPYWQLPAYFFSGVAPLSRVIPIKVADANGTTDVTQVIQAIDWAVAHRNDHGLRIRVVNLSYGVYAYDSASENLLSHAIQAAWDNGVAVVVAAGNDGAASRKASPGITSPADNDTVIAVGSFGPGGVSGFTSGSSSSNKRMPDIVAPGQSIPSLRAVGATADDQVLDSCEETIAGNPAAGAAPATWRQPIVGPDGRFLRGSGTSQSAAMVSGAVALMLSQRPDLSPDEVKGLLRGKATRIGGSPRNLQGQGMVRLDRVIKAKPPKRTQKHQKLTGDGTVDAARGYDSETGQAALLWDPEVLTGTFELLKGACKDAATVPADVPVPGCYRRYATLRGDVDITGTKINLSRLRAKQRAGKAWRTVENGDGSTSEVWEGTGRAFTGATWVADSDFGRRWEGRRWSGRSWSGRRWSGRRWSGRRWSGRRWSGRRWSGENWSGRSWSGRRWSGRRWSGRRWSDDTWS